MVNCFAKASQVQHPSLVLRQRSVQTEARLPVNYLLQNQDWREDHLNGIGCGSLGWYVVQSQQRRLVRLRQGLAYLSFKQGVHDGRLLASGSDDHTVKIWGLQA